jgi:glycosyltransferase involved in cell wall biosynthesis
MSRRCAASVGDLVNKLPTIAIILPVLNEESFIRGTLMALLEQDYPQTLIRILVIDGGSVDATVERVREFMTNHAGRIELLHNPNRWASYARNIGIANSTEDFVLFVDAHVHITSRYVVRQMATCALGNDALVLGRSQPLDPPGINWFQFSIAGVRSSPLGHSMESHIYREHEGWVSPFSIGVMYHRSIFDRFGIFDESFDAAEDLEYNYRLEQAGIKAYISPRFTVRYYPRRDFLRLFQQMTRYGVGRFMLVRKHPERMRFELLLPCFITVSLLALPVLFVSVPQLMFVAFSLLIALGLLIILLAFPVAVRGGIASIILAPVCFIVIHTGLAFGLMQGAWREGVRKMAGRNAPEHRS